MGLAVKGNGLLVREPGRLSVGDACCCRPCPKSCDRFSLPGVGLPSELLFSIKTFSYGFGSISLNPVGDYIIPVDETGCSVYTKGFFPNEPPLAPCVLFDNFCFVGCAYKLIILLIISGPGVSVSIAVADYIPQDSIFGGEVTGGRSVGSFPASALCSRAFPITGTVTPANCVPFTATYEIKLP
jgi:hypothetical protein